MARGFLLVVAIGLILSVHAGGAIKCYQCNSETNKDCADPVSSDGIKKTEVECTPDIAKDFLNNAANVAKSLAGSFGTDLFPQGTIKMEMACHKIKKKINDNEVVIRTCAPGGSVDICKDSKDLFCEQCDKDLCNGTERLGGLPVLFYVLLPCIVALVAIRA